MLCWCFQAVYDIGSHLRFILLKNRHALLQLEHKHYLTESVINQTESAFITRPPAEMDMGQDKVSTSMVEAKDLAQKPSANVLARLKERNTTMLN